MGTTNGDNSHAHTCMSYDVVNLSWNTYFSGEKTFPVIYSLQKTEKDPLKIILETSYILPDYGFIPHSWQDNLEQLVTLN